MRKGIIIAACMIASSSAFADSFDNFAYKVARDQWEAQQFSTIEGQLNQLNGNAQTEHINPYPSYRYVPKARYCSDFLFFEHCW